ncbi:hypothetical protein DMENIID0001_161460 [Sergentomyia squamirostris]
MERYSDCCKVFVVGRREDFRSGTGIWVQGRNWIVERRESDLLSNFSLEAKSIVDACKISGSLGGNVLIVTNSRGVLESLVNFKNNNPFVAFLKDFIIKNRGFRFQWDPGILESSVRTCILSKNAASKEYIGRDVVTVKDINRFCQDIQKGQRALEWERVKSDENKLRSLGVNFNFYNPFTVRREQVALTRLRTGHAFFTHGYLMEREMDSPSPCERCDGVLSIKHVLLECPDFESVRRDIAGAGELPELSKMLNHNNLSSLRKIFSFFEERNLRL